MPQAAIPRYLNKHIDQQDIPPGHRFGLFFPVWQSDWTIGNSGKKDALKTVAKILPVGSVKLADNLQKRQRAIALETPHLAYFPAKSTSPFMTGIGNEHPLENGFSFLNPYGLPYLPGSSVKGVLRTAAEELALGLYGETAGWDMLAVWLLFGFEAGGSMFQGKPYQIDVLDEEAERRRKAYQAWLEKGAYDQDALRHLIEAVADKNDRKKYADQPYVFLADIADKKTLRETMALQGALCFWDVFPQSNNLTMGILTPHHTGYFQGRNGVLNAPHDSEQPVPNVFLTIPPNSSFDFYCHCQTGRLPASLKGNWQTLIKTAFEHAFDWLGFGAKTAVGYGQMKPDDQAVTEFEKRKFESVKTVEKEKQQQELAKKLAAFSPLAQEFIREMEKGNWEHDKNAFSQNGVIEKWLDKLTETPDVEIINRLKVLLDAHYPGLRQNPDQVQGKKLKPVFSDRQRNMAKKLAEF